MKRPKDRVFGAVIKGGRILMVRHRHDGRAYWTLPGGGIEAGETPEQAVVREVKEETDLDVEVERRLFTEMNETPRGRREAVCFLLRFTGGRAKVGHDPELPPHGQMITEVRWFPLGEVNTDCQVSRVIAALEGKA